MSASIVWGRGTGDGIGLSGHKNEYQPGVSIGNWVEEQFGREAPPRANSLQVRRSCRSVEREWWRAVVIALAAAAACGRGGRGRGERGLWNGL